MSVESSKFLVSTPLKMEGSRGHEKLVEGIRAAIAAAPVKSGPAVQANMPAPF